MAYDDALKLSELIAELTAMLQEHGDLPVLYSTYDESVEVSGAMLCDEQDGRLAKCVVVTGC